MTSQPFSLVATMFLLVNSGGVFRANLRSLMFAETAFGIIAYALIYVDICGLLLDDDGDDDVTSFSELVRSRRTRRLMDRSTNKQK